MIAKKDLEEVLQAALGGGDFAEIFLERRTQTRVSCEDRKIERVISGREEGAGIRIVKGDSTAYGYTTDLSKEGLLKLAELVARGRRSSTPALMLPDKEKAPTSSTIKERPDRVGIERKVALVREAEEAARSVDEKLVRQVTVGYADVLQQVTIANSEGVFVEDERVRCRLVVNVVASDGQVIQTGYESAGGTRGLELFEEGKPAALGRRAAERALLMLKARRAPAGRMPVVISGEAGGTMIHEACGHGLEADLVQKNLSVYAGKKGEQVASELVTVIDDGTLPGKYGAFRFDDEGNPSQRTVLIEKGILRGYMYDRMTAARDGAEPTGNGRRESFRHRPIPRMSTTYLAPGKDSPEEIIRDTKNGLFVRKMGGGQVNTTTGDFVFEVLEGYLIEDGKVTVPVRGATLTGNGPEVLRIIDRVGNDLGFSLGTCGKDGQGVPVSDAQPTIRIPELVVGGILEEEGDLR
ncbi:PmbA/TldD protein [Thermacetogenium phaeum DSM 12270]|jgi:TldD protein|uniref:PmbA/TldD protein n=2 Tax=Thermacetogenium phaeum TaxID=85874 RepID=K4LII1_THEPS|nr:TldD/PmbA family protein [Thermacetogenium phaeum]MDK2881440.1 TldD protein [Clostridia bacterium]MDN5365589.1 TldD protein [Thermacetogenium sp.]AFV11857.1 PmbA/TldD protein [Thermacetogenium phaeum DSM 12270]KUK36146.1 MAG: PmbA/TldD protein [Thermacetogenium phaeum]MDN5376136.1 TldD protein [Thermacetogenium sp.]